MRSRYEALRQQQHEKSPRGWGGCAGHWHRQDEPTGIPALSFSPSRVPGARQGKTGRNSHQLDESWREGGLTSTAPSILQPWFLGPVMTGVPIHWGFDRRGRRLARDDSCAVHATRQAKAARRRAAPWARERSHKHLSAEKEKEKGAAMLWRCARRSSLSSSSRKKKRLERGAPSQY